MGCNCGGGNGGVKVMYVATFPDGTTREYTTEVEARTATAARGGSYTARTVR